MTEPTTEYYEAPVESFEDFDVPADDSEIEDIPDAPVAAESEKAPKAPAKPKRGDLPELEGDQYITPVAFAKLLSQPIDGNVENLDESNWRHNDKNGNHVVAPQMIYSYVKSSKKLPTYTVTDLNGVERGNILKLSEANAFWDGRATAAVERAANAKAKAEKKAAKASESPTTVAEEAEASEVVEAE